MVRISLLTVILVLISLPANSQLARAQVSHLPATQGSKKSLQSAPPRTLSFKGHFKVVRPVRVLFYPSSKTPRVSLTPLPMPLKACSVPLLQAKIPPDEIFTTKQVPAESADLNMVVQPPAPSCGETK